MRRRGLRRPGPRRRLAGAAAAIAATAGLSACSGSAQLYDGDAGFLQARTGQGPVTPIRVGALPGFDVQRIVAPWNQDAGRTIAVVDTRDPQVTFVGDLTGASRAAWVQPLPDRFGPYTSCVIHYDPARLVEGLGLTGLQHEFGHCLGFRDIEHFPQQIWAENEQCSAPGQPRHNDAPLRMSYCFYRTPHLWGGEWDRRSLFDAGYGVRNG